MLSDADAEAVYCAVPHNLHEQFYTDIIKAGKHLLGEKPFGIDKAANDAIMKCIEEHPHVFVRCTSHFPFFPPMQRIGRMIEEQAFGQIIEVNSGFLHASDLNPDKPINWKRILKVNGEYGCMGDMGWTPAFGGITGGIFEFGFSDAVQQLWAAFLHELTEGNPKSRFAGCVTPREVAYSHRLFTAALKSQKISTTEKV